MTALEMAFIRFKKRLARQFNIGCAMKTLVIYAHLLATCVAIGLLLLQDAALAKSRGRALSVKAIKDLATAAEIMFVALVVLWITGLGLVLLGYLENPQQYFMNEKLWAKFTVVSVLTLNGVLLHYFSFPRVTARRGLLGRTKLEQRLVAATGAISSTSWLFACYLGIARPWNYTVDYGFVMFIYAGFLIVAVFTAGEVMRKMRTPEPPLLTEKVHLQSARHLD